MRLTTRSWWLAPQGLPKDATSEVSEAKAATRKRMAARFHLVFHFVFSSFSMFHVFIFSTLPFFSCVSVGCHWSHGAQQQEEIFACTARHARDTNMEYDFPVVLAFLPLISDKLTRDISGQSVKQIPSRRTRDGKNCFPMCSEGGSPLWRTETP